MPEVREPTTAALLGAFYREMCAEGLGRTIDGRDIALDLILQMQREGFDFSVKKEFLR